MSWQKRRLGEGLLIKHGFAFTSKFFDDDPSLPNVVTPGNFSISGGFKKSKPKTYSGELSSGHILKPGDLIITMTDLSKKSDTLGAAAIVPNDGESYLHNQRIGLVETLQPAIFDLRFVRYLTSTFEYRQHVVGTATGTTVRHTSPARILEYSTSIPDVQTQRAIAEVLGALDDKIAANERVVAIADQMAISVLEANLVNENTTLGELAQVTMGTSPSGETFNEHGEGEPFFQGVRDFGARVPLVRIWTTKPVRMASAGEILLSVRAPVGRLNRAHNDLAIGRGLAAVRALDGQNNLLYYRLRVAEGEWLSFSGDGTLFSSVNRKQIESIKVRNLIGESEDQIAHTIDSLELRLRSALAESAILASTRDELLPLLMSGKITVKDAEKVVSDAV